MLQAGREIGLHFTLHAIWENVAHNAHAYRAAAGELLAAGAVASRSAADYFATLGKPLGWADQYREKAEAIEAYLNATP